jgi:hypothetical protein
MLVVWLVLVVFLLRVVLIVVLVVYKIQFLLKKLNDNRESLEYVSISDPKVNRVKNLS